MIINMQQQTDLPLSHDKLLQLAFTWLWNTYPQTRLTCFHPRNELPRMPGESLGSFKRRLSVARGLGIVPGVTDLLFYWRGCMYAWDAKVGTDKLSKQQLAFIQAVVGQGGEGGEFRTLDQFKGLVGAVMGCGNNWGGTPLNTSK